MFASLQTLRTHCLHFQYDVSNVPSHTEHVKRSLETSKIEKKAKICWFSGFAAITKRKNRKVPLSARGINIFQNPFNSTFLNLNAKKKNYPAKPNVDLVRRNLDFCVFLGLGGPENGSAGPKSNLEVKFISREISICQNPFNSTFLHLNAKKNLNS